MTVKDYPDGTLRTATARAPGVTLNRLIHETSPYLLQHARNPVDWYPWGEEAFERARREDKPILLSIGYASCHWCHVMERESFEDPETAAILNERFVPVKVDREERPDIDEVYIAAVQMIMGSGGWPLSVFLTPDLEPFYGGTYFPPEDRHGLPAFRRLLFSVSALWSERRERALESAEQLTDAIRSYAEATHPRADLPSADALSRALASLAASFDPHTGGFGEAPKFPAPAAIEFLLRVNRREPAPETLRMATRTLDAMARGGIYDQIGGGFHRYATDAEWIVPHFEKMLYDNALLAQTYTDAWQVTKKPLYKRIAIETLDYILRDMSDARGGFHSSEDADSGGREGGFYLWTLDEIRRPLKIRADAELACLYYGATREGNLDGSNVLHVAHEPEEFARAARLTTDELLRNIDRLREILRKARARRKRPAKDDKILLAWNAMTISALAKAAQTFGEVRFLEPARRAADFVLNEMRTADGGLYRTWRRGVASIPAFHDDYAYLVVALIDLYESTFDLRRLEEADVLARRMIDGFWDTLGDGFFLTSEEHDRLPARIKTLTDGSTPSGNSVAALALLRLSRLLGKDYHADRARRILCSGRTAMESFPRSFLGLYCALDDVLSPPPEIALVGPVGAEPMRRLLETVYRRYIPGRSIAVLDPWYPDAARVERSVPFLQGKTTVDAKSTAYVCRDGVCQRPATDTALLSNRLDEA